MSSDESPPAMLIALAMRTMDEGGINDEVEEPVPSANPVTINGFWHPSISWEVWQPN